MHGNYKKNEGLVTVNQGGHLITKVFHIKDKDFSGNVQSSRRYLSTRFLLCSIRKLLEKF